MPAARSTAPLRVLVLPLLLIVALLAGCSSSDGAAGDPVTVTGTQGGAIAAPGSATGADAGATSGADSTAGQPTSSDSAESSGAQSSAGSEPATSSEATTSSSPTPEPPVARISADPKIGSKAISPIDPITVSVEKGTIDDLALTNATTGYEVKGTLAEDGASWTSGEVLGYGKKYTLAGTATGTDGKSVEIAGSYTTLKPTDEARSTIYPADGMEVGVAMPVMVKFSVEPQDRALIEKSVKVTTDPEVEGAWAWIQHDGGTWGLDYRPKGYWPEGTKVHVEANLYGLEFGDGVYGKTDITSDFTIGRNQVVLADVNSHELVVQQDGQTVATYPASYGQGNGNPDLTTRSGIHVVNEKFAEKRMSNPKYGYVNLLERWAVRISNNGEFIHANPNSTDAQGNTNVTHGCVNLSTENAEAYYNSVMIGDPVEVTGTDIQLAPSDGDIFDYALDWDVWLSLSALN